MSRRILVVAASVAVASALILVARRAADFTTLGDSAVTEAYTRLAVTGHLLLGPYSRFQWHHPGPLYFFGMAPFYVLSGSRPAGLNAAALALNLAALTFTTTVVVRRAGSVLAIAMLVSMALFSWRASPVLVSPWNPH